MGTAPVTPESEDDIARVEIITLARGTAAVYCARSPLKSREEPNEDGAVLIPIGSGRTILAVADGMGGHASGAQASDVALRALGTSVQAAEAGDSTLRGAVLNGFEAANTRVIEETSGAGTTLAVVEVDGTTIRPYHAGDSVILVVGQRGKVKLQTVAHSPVGYAVEAGLLDESDAMHHAERHVISNFVGSPDMRIEIGTTLALSPRDTVVLGSDGLFDNLHVEEVVGRVRKGPLECVARALATLSRDRMLNPVSGHPSKPDDLTFIIYRPGDPGSEG